MAAPLSDLVEAGWAEALAPAADRITEMGAFLRAEIAEGREYLPSGDNVLRAFTHPFAEVKVLIVGQDPYPTPGHAVGAQLLGGARRATRSPQSRQHLRRVQQGPRFSDAVHGRSDTVVSSGRVAVEQGPDRPARTSCLPSAEGVGSCHGTGNSRVGGANRTPRRHSLGPGRVHLEADACRRADDRERSPFTAVRVARILRFTSVQQSERTARQPRRRTRELGTALAFTPALP